MQEATGILGKKLDDYEWAIRKHGLKTTMAALAHILDPKAVTAVAADAGAAGSLARPVGAAIAGGLVLSSRVVTWLVDRRIALQDVKQGKDSEVAIIYEARKRLGEGRGD